MNPEIKARWVAALRSGEYRQGDGFLRIHQADDSDLYCCLGVLCDLAVQDGLAFWSKPKSSQAAASIVTQASRDCTGLPVPIREWAGLPARAMTPELRHSDGALHWAAVFNDGDKTLGVSKHSFEEIADLIEQQL